MLILLALLGNSGCLVDTGSDLTDPKAITQKHLRIYRQNDEIRYDVQRNGVASGTLIIKWQLPIGDEIVDADPTTTELEVIPGLLKETTTLELDILDGPIIVVRYITQDTDVNSPNYGSITAHAFNSAEGPVQHNYVHNSTNLPATQTLQPQVVFPSPLQLDDNFNPVAGQSNFPIDYYVLPCSTEFNRCDQGFQRYQESLVFSQMIKEDLDTTLDSFQSLRISYSGIVDNTGGGNAIRLDFRTFCASVTATNILFSDMLWIYPSIGVVRYGVFCGGEYISAIISSTNFAY